MLSRLITIVAFCAVGYWFYTEMWLMGRPSPQQAEYEENDRIMKECMRRERSMTAGGGMAGVAVDSGDPEKVCADKHGMYQEDGLWKKY